MIPANYKSLTVQLNSALDQLRVANRQRELAEREVLSLKERLRAKENSLEEMIADLKDMKPDRKTQEKLAAAQEQDKKVAQLTEEVGSLTHTARTFDRRVKLIGNGESCYRKSLVKIMSWIIKVITRSSPMECIFYECD